MISNINNLGYTIAATYNCGHLSKKVVTHQLEQDNPIPTPEPRKVEEIEQPNQSKNENHTPAKDYMPDIKPNLKIEPNKKQVASKYQKEQQALGIKERIVKGIA